MKLRSLPLALLLIPLAGAACAQDAPEPAAEAPEAPPAADAPAASGTATVTVAILEPAESAEVAGPSVHVRLTAEGIQIVPAGQLVPGPGHHHLYLDADLTPPEAPVPTIPGQVIHLGTGVSEYTFESVAPGAHRLIAVVADGVHVPLQPWVVDTVTFTVK